MSMGAGERMARTILVTSPGEQEGKSTLISNLAVALAQSGQRTLVLDADFHQPCQHTIFRLSNEVGLSSVLGNGGQLNGAILRSEQPGLDVLPAGPAPEHPSELLSRRGYLEVLRRLGEQYDVVLIDSPPVTAVADTLILAARSDATLLVLRGAVAPAHGRGGVPIADERRRERVRGGRQRRVAQRAALRLLRTIRRGGGREDRRQQHCHREDREVRE